MGHLPNPKQIWTRVGSRQLRMSCWIIQDTQTGAIRLLITMIQTQVRETLIKTLKKVLMERGVLSPATSSFDLKQIATTLQEPKPSSIRILNLLSLGKKSPRHFRIPLTLVVLSTRLTILERLMQPTQWCTQELRGASSKSRWLSNCKKNSKRLLRMMVTILLHLRIQKQQCTLMTAPKNSKLKNL